MRVSLLIVLVACASSPPPTQPPAPAPIASQVADASVEATAPAPLECLVRYYGAAAKRDGDTWRLQLHDGQTVAYGEVKDVYEIVYPTGAIRPITEVDFDPGRVRIDALLLATYGRTAKEVQAALVPVKVGGATVLVHRKIADPLRRVSARLDVAMKKDPGLGRFFTKLGGTFNWRMIAGSDSLSLHSWGVAIDLNTELADYWRNEPQNRPLEWKNRYPQAIVDAFEAEGFIWGGRWYHFDTMHFEYRPELLDASCYPRSAHGTSD